MTLHKDSGWPEAWCLSLITCWWQVVLEVTAHQPDQKNPRTTVAVTSVTEDSTLLPSQELKMCGNCPGWNRPLNATWRTPTFPLSELKECQHRINTPRGFMSSRSKKISCSCWRVTKECSWLSLKMPRPVKIPVTTRIFSDYSCVSDF